MRRKLENFSSVNLEWTLLKPKLGKLNKDGILMETSVHAYAVLGRDKSVF